MIAERVGSACERDESAKRETFDTEPSGGRENTQQQTRRLSLLVRRSKEVFFFSSSAFWCEKGESPLGNQTKSTRARFCFLCVAGRRDVNVISPLSGKCRSVCLSLTFTKVLVYPSHEGDEKRRAKGTPPLSLLRVRATTKVKNDFCSTESGRGARAFSTFYAYFPPKRKNKNLRLMTRDANWQKKRVGENYTPEAIS